MARGSQVRHLTGTYPFAWSIPTSLTILIVLITASLLVSCRSGVDTAPAPTPTRLPADVELTPADEEFLDQIALIDAEVVLAEDALRNILTSGDGDSATALEAVGAKSILEVLDQAARQLRADVLVGDHETYLAYLHSGVGSATRMGWALDDGDVDRALQSVTEIVDARARLASDVSTIFCLRVLAGVPDELCWASALAGAAAEGS